MSIGLDLKTYRNAGVYASPTWSAIISVKDESIPGGATKVDKSTRAGTVKQFAIGHLETGLTFTLTKSDDSASFVALRTAYLNRTPLDVAAADGPIATTGTEYFRQQLMVAKFEITRNLEQEVEAAVELCVSDAVTHPPAYVTV